MYKLTIELSMIIDEKTNEASIEEITDSLKEALEYSKNNQSKDFKLKFDFQSID